MVDRLKLQDHINISHKTIVSVFDRPNNWMGVSKNGRVNAISRSGEWGLFPLLALSSSIGVLLVAVTYAYSRAGITTIEPMLWVGLLILVMPAAARLIAISPSRRERIALVILLGLSLYLIKFIHSPFVFTFSDEIVHSYNVIEITRNKTLFNSNGILPVTPLYPGLEIVTAALISLSGLPIFEAGIIVIGFARLIMILALFLLYEHVSGSERVAGIGTLLYIGTPNFVFWSVQFSYESLALPMAVMVLYAVARRATLRNQFEHVGMTLFVLMTILAIVITHHMTSYAITGFLLLLSILYVAYRYRYRVQQPSIWGLALFALVMTLIWLFFVASMTINYLSPVLTRAVGSIIDMAAGEETGRQLFHSSTGYVAPLWERATGIGSVLLLLLAMPVGLWQIWRKHLSNAVVLLLGGAALGYFGALGMRFTPAGWETGNRAASFMFIGLAFTVGLGFVEFWTRSRLQRFVAILFPFYVAVIVVGGIIAGWPPSLRFARPLFVEANGRVFEPQGMMMARWTLANIGPNRLMAADGSNALLLMAYGEQKIFSGREPDAKGLLGLPGFNTWQQDTLSQLEYIVVDRRSISWNVMEGIYFDQLTNGSLTEEDLLDREVYTKFESLPQANRVFDSGNIVIYDVLRYYNPH